MFCELIKKKTKKAHSLFEIKLDKVISRFKKECGAQARYGIKFCFYNEDITCTKDTKHIYERILREKSDTLGFSQKGCRISKKKNKYTINIWASWDLTSEPDRHSNFLRKCPVCIEETFVNALVPCGHLICKKCTKFTTCPICRKNIQHSLPLYEA